MNDLIKRSAAIDAVNMNSRRKSDILYRIKHIPSEDAVSVVKGTWKISKYNGDLQRYAVCDRCGYQYGAGIFNGFDCIGIKYYNFCPNCGADMRKGESMSRCTKKNCPMQYDTVLPDCDIKNCSWRTEDAVWVKVVRCKECKYWNTDGCREGCGECEWAYYMTKPDDYCSYGEREGE